MNKYNEIKTKQNKTTENSLSFDSELNISSPFSKKFLIDSFNIQVNTSNC